MGEELVGQEEFSSLKARIVSNLLSTVLGTEEATNRSLLPHRDAPSIFLSVSAQTEHYKEK